MSYHDDFDDNMTYTQSRVKDSAITKFNNYNLNTAEKSGYKNTNIRVDGKGYFTGALTSRIIQRPL